MKKVTIISLFVSLLVSSFAIANEVNIFNARHYKADNELYSKFTNKIALKKPIISINKIKNIAFLILKNLMI